MDNVFFEDQGMRTMEKYLDLAVHRQALIAGNIANIDTPGYKTIDLNFQRELQHAADGELRMLRDTNTRHLPGGADPRREEAIEVEGLTLRNDLNNVNIDREMGQMSMNVLKFSMVAQMLAGRLRTLKAAIQEGR